MKKFTLLCLFAIGMFAFSTVARAETPAKYHSQETIISANDFQSVEIVGMDYDFVFSPVTYQPTYDLILFSEPKVNEPVKTSYPFIYVKRFDYRNQKK